MALIERSFTMDNEQIVEKVAEYLSIAPFLKEDSLPELYQRANQLAHELIVWMPPELYRELVKTVTGKLRPAFFWQQMRVEYNDNKEVGDTFIIHAPGIGKEKP
jgi:hypothetical protein